MRRGLLAVALLWLLTGCAGPFLFGPAAGDWIFDELPEGYEVWRANARSVTLQRRQEDGRGPREILGTYLSQIAYTQNYIFAQQVVPPADLRAPMDLRNPVFFLVYAGDETVAGPYTEEEFEQEYAALGLEEGPTWLGVSDLAARVRERGEG